MPMRSGRPSSLDGLKRLAKEIKAERGLQHARALDEAARLAGFSNFAHARRSLSNDRIQGQGAPSLSVQKERSVMLSDFHRRTHAAWTSAISSVLGPDRPASSTWRDPDVIASVLAPIMGSNNNHTHLPGGGGLDMRRVRVSDIYPDCLEFYPFDSEDHLYLMKPRRLVLEYFDHAPAESFFHLELDQLKPAAVLSDSEDDEVPDERPRASRYERYMEEVVEVGPGDFVSRSGWDDGVYPNGRKLPADARLVVRCLSGAAMAVAKGSRWNGASETYDGRHARMSPSEIRNVIERAIGRSSDER